MVNVLFQELQVDVYGKKSAFSVKNYSQEFIVKILFQEKQLEVYHQKLAFSFKNYSQEFMVSISFLELEVHDQNSTLIFFQELQPEVQSQKSAFLLFFFFSRTIARNSWSKVSIFCQKLGLQSGVHSQHFIFWSYSQKFMVDFVPKEREPGVYGLCFL